MRWALIAGWVLALGYYALRVSLLAVPDYCPDKIWDDRPPECEWTSFDVALFATLPMLVVATALFGLVTLVRKLRSIRRVSR
jgi:hypothetical protein